MRSRIIRRVYRSGINKRRMSHGKRLRIFRKFKKSFNSFNRRRFNTFRKRKFHKNKTNNKKLSNEQLDKDLEKYFKNDKDSKEKDTDVEMKDDTKSEESNKSE